jgi:hypothetical protein
MAHYDCSCCGESMGISHRHCDECKAGRCHLARKPVLLGMNNPVSSDPAHALYPYPSTCTGARLLKFSGLDKQTYLSVFERRNVLSGVEWSAKRAREVAPSLREELRGRTVVLLGAPVNSVMRGGTPHELAEPFVWTPDGYGGWMAKVPHPSGLNHFFNNHLHRELLSVFMAELVHFSQETKNAA